MNEQQPGSASLIQADSMPKKHFKSFWPIIIIAVMSALIGGLIVWIAFNNGLDEQLNSLLPGSNYKKTHLQENNVKKMQPEENLEGASEWKTYRNEEYGFEFKCPLSWQYSEANDDRPEGSPTAFFCSYNKTRVGILPIGGFGYGTPFEQPDITKLKLAGKNAVKTSWHGWYEENPENRLDIYQIWDPVKNWIECDENVEKNCNRIDILSETDRDFKITEEILATFTFIK